MDIKNILLAMLNGAYDSIRGIGTLIYMDKELDNRTRQRLSPSRQSSTIRRRESDLTKEATPVRTLKAHEESKVLKRTIQCSVLNGGIFLASIMLFDYGILPFLNFVLQMIFGENTSTSGTIWSWTRPFLVCIFQAIWVMPLFLLSKCVNCLWFQDIADNAYRYSRGRPQIAEGLSKRIADSIFSIVVQTLFLVQAMLIDYIPIFLIGRIFSCIHLCMLYSLYTFEYKWYNMRWELHRRLTFIETNWPYFIGFGLPMTILTQVSDSWIINGCIFSILFPLFIVSGNEASPVTHTVNFPLSLFSPVIAITNTILNRSIDAANAHMHANAKRR